MLIFEFLVVECSLQANFQFSRQCYPQPLTNPTDPSTFVDSINNTRTIASNLLASRSILGGPVFTSAMTTQPMTMNEEARVFLAPILANAHSVEMIVSVATPSTTAVKVLWSDKYTLWFWTIGGNVRLRITLMTTVLTVVPVGNALTIPWTTATHILWTISAGPPYGVTVYVNGVLFGSATETGNPLPPLGPTLNVGAPSSSWVFTFHSLRLYNTAIDATEAASLYSASSVEMFRPPSLSHCSLAFDPISNNPSMTGSCALLGAAQNVEIMLTAPIPSSCFTLQSLPSEALLTNQSYTSSNGSLRVIASTDGSCFQTTAEIGLYVRTPSPQQSFVSGPVIINVSYHSSAQPSVGSPTLTITGREIADIPLTATYSAAPGMLFDGSFRIESVSPGIALLELLPNSSWVQVATPKTYSASNNTTRVGLRYIGMQNEHVSTHPSGDPIAAYSLKFKALSLFGIESMEGALQINLKSWLQSGNTSISMLAGKTAAFTPVLNVLQPLSEYEVKVIAATLPSVGSVFAALSEGNEPLIAGTAFPYSWASSFRYTAIDDLNSAEATNLFIPIQLVDVFTGLRSPAGTVAVTVYPKRRNMTTHIFLSTFEDGYSAALYAPNSSVTVLRDVSGNSGLTYMQIGDDRVSWSTWTPYFGLDVTPTSTVGVNVALATISPAIPALASAAVELWLSKVNDLSGEILRIGSTVTTGHCPVLLLAAQSNKLRISSGVECSYREVAFIVSTSPLHVLVAITRIAQQNTLTIFINGVSQHIFSANADGAPGLFVSDDSLHFAKHSWEGTIHLLALHNTYITELQAEQLYTTGLKRRPPFLAADSVYAIVGQKTYIDLSAYVSPRNNSMVCTLTGVEVAPCFQVSDAVLPLPFVIPQCTLAVVSSSVPCDPSYLTLHFESAATISPVKLSLIAGEVPQPVRPSEAVMLPPLDERVLAYSHSPLAPLRLNISDGTLTDGELLTIPAFCAASKLGLGGIHQSIAVNTRIPVQDNPDLLIFVYCTLPSAGPLLSRSDPPTSSSTQGNITVLLRTISGTSYLVTRRITVESSVGFLTSYVKVDALSTTFSLSSRSYADDVLASGATFTLLDLSYGSVYENQTRVAFDLPHRVSSPLLLEFRLNSSAPQVSEAVLAYTVYDAMLGLYGSSTSKVVFVLPESQISVPDPPVFDLAVETETTAITVGSILPLNITFVDSMNASGLISVVIDITESPSSMGIAIAPPQASLLLPYTFEVSLARVVFTVPSALASQVLAGVRLEGLSASDSATVRVRVQSLAKLAAEESPREISVSRSFKIGPSSDTASKPREKDSLSLFDSLASWLGVSTPGAIAIFSAWLVVITLALIFITYRIVKCLRGRQVLFSRLIGLWKHIDKLEADLGRDQSLTDKPRETDVSLKREDSPPYPEPPHLYVANAPGLERPKRRDSPDSSFDDISSIDSSTSSDDASRITWPVQPQPNCASPREFGPALTTSSVQIVVRPLARRSLTFEATTNTPAKTAVADVPHDSECDDSQSHD